MRIILRADGSAEMGMGHIKRVLALKEFLSEEAEVLFVLGKHDDEAARLVERGGLELHVLENLGEKEEAGELTKLGSFDWFVCDRLNEWYTEDYFPIMKKATGARAIAIDDLGGKRIAADYVVNGSAVENWHDYPEGTGKVFAGTEYMVLGKRFAELNAERREFGEAHNILITVGGSDPDGLSARICDGIAGMDSGLEFKVLATSAFPPNVLERLGEISGKDPRFAVVQNLGDVPGMLFSADLAVACAGVTAYELACAGTPAILMGKVAHQTETADAFAGLGFGTSMGDAGKLDCGRLLHEAEELVGNAGKRKAFSEKGRRLVDGKGGERIASLLCA